MRGVAFGTQQKREQSAYFSRFPASDLMEKFPYRLKAKRYYLNLNPVFADDIVMHFRGDPARKGSRITWHRHCNHALSSQVCCLNFLAPLMRAPKLLARVLGDALGIDAPEVLPIGKDGKGRDIFVDFEWVGESSYLDEWTEGKGVSRGANATSTDAIARIVLPEGICTVLIEWKYTETYGAPLKDDAGPDRGNRTRVRRYADKLFYPDGPVRNDLGLRTEDFFWEPFYQMARQQMLAWRMQLAREQGVDRVIVLHLSPRANTKLHRVTAPALRERSGEEGDAFDVFRSLLVRPEDFRSSFIEDAFLPSLEAAATSREGREWAVYLLDRYGFLRAEGTRVG